MAIIDRDLGLENYTPPEARTTAEVLPSQSESDSSITRSFLLDEVVHVVELEIQARNGMADRFAVTSLRTFNQACGREKIMWVLLGSAERIDTKTQEPYAIADFQPKGAPGRTSMHTVHIHINEGAPVLFTAPHSMPREMESGKFTPKIARRFRGSTKHDKHGTNG